MRHTAGSLRHLVQGGRIPRALEDPVKPHTPVAPTPAARKATAVPVDVRMRLVALPAEHGGWGLLMEPIALGLAVAPTAAGAVLGPAALGGVLARHPPKIALADRRRSV